MRAAEIKNLSVDSELTLTFGAIRKATVSNGFEYLIPEW